MNLRRTNKEWQFFWTTLYVKGYTRLRLFET